MLLAVVTSLPGLITPEMAKVLGPFIQETIAKELDCSDKGGNLSPEDIEVQFRESGPLDINTSPFALMVFANEYESRKANLQDRAHKIASAVGKHEALPNGAFDGFSSFVWILLAPAGFAKL